MVSHFCSTTHKFSQIWCRGSVITERGSKERLIIYCQFLLVLRDVQPPRPCLFPSASYYAVFCSLPCWATFAGNLYPGDIIGHQQNCGIFRGNMFNFWPTVAIYWRSFSQMSFMKQRPALPLKGKYKLVSSNLGDCFMFSYRLELNHNCSMNRLLLAQF